MVDIFKNKSYVVKKKGIVIGLVKAKTECTAKMKCFKVYKLDFKLKWIDVFKYLNNTYAIPLKSLHNIPHKDFNDYNAIPPQIFDENNEFEEKLAYNYIRAYILISKYT